MKKLLLLLPLVFILAGCTTHQQSSQSVCATLYENHKQLPQDKIDFIKGLIKKDGYQKPTIIEEDGWYKIISDHQLLYFALFNENKYGIYKTITFEILKNDEKIEGAICATRVHTNQDINSCSIDRIVKLEKNDVITVLNDGVESDIIYSLIFFEKLINQ